MNAFTIRTVPVLGPQHWVLTPQQIFDQVMSDFFVSEYSQDTLFRDSVTSLTWIIQTSYGDITACCTAIQESLRTYLTSYFNNVDVEAAEIPSDNTMKADIRVFVTCNADDGTELNLGKLIRSESGKITEIINANA